MFEISTVVLAGVIVNTSIAFLTGKRTFQSSGGVIVFIGHWSLLLLLPVFQVYKLVPSFPITNQYVSQIETIGSILFVVGLLITALGRFSLGKSYSNGTNSRIVAGQRLITGGIYLFSRNPIYLGKILLFVGFELMLNSLILVLVVPIIAVFHYAILREESLLEQEFGSDFQAYCRKVGRYL